jgi:hypothetical protein
MKIISICGYRLYPVKQSLLQNNERIGLQIQRAFQISWTGVTGPAYHRPTLCNISQPQGLLSKSTLSQTRLVERYHCG